MSEECERADMQERTVERAKVAVNGLLQRTGLEGTSALISRRKVLPE